MARLVAAISPELKGAGRCLEIGVGTGRFAIPLAAAGVEIVGVDISREMLRRLAANAPGVDIPTALADATRLPFRDATFAAGLAAHVLHLVPGWRTAIDELIRVVRPGGRIAVFARGRAQDGWLRDLHRVFYAAAGDPPWPPGMDGIEQLDADMLGRGIEGRVLPPYDEARVFTVRRSIEMLEQGIYSACWTLDEKERARAAAVATRWAETELGSLDEPRPVVESMSWRLYDLR